MHITLHDSLKCFAEVLKSGLFPTTGRRSCCHYRSPPLAPRSPIWKVSSAYGLFDRVGKRLLVVSEHGRLLYPRALALLEQAVKIRQLFREDNGAIRVYASSTIGDTFYPP